MKRHHAGAWESTIDLTYTYNNSTGKKVSKILLSFSTESNTYITKARKKNKKASHFLVWQCPIEPVVPPHGIDHGNNDSILY